MTNTLDPAFPPRLAALEEAKARLADHAVYRSLSTVEDLRRFMEHHVVCVLDFMSLVKSLQRDLTSVGPVWVPPTDPEAARFVNEIVLDEESDAAFGERPASHFEWYLAAMDQVGADTGPIRDVVERLRAGEAPDAVLASCALPTPSAAFGRQTFALLEEPLHVRAAVFFHGREDVIPRMFLPLVRELSESGTSCGLLLGYLERHIEADGEHHGPLASRMLDSLFASDPDREREGVSAALGALDAREALWNAVARRR
ncbi:MAG: DUF3050 domain-containing protein [Planctomycetota bacterium]